MFELMMKWKAAGLQILWPDDVHSLPGWKALITRILQVSFAVIRDFLEGQLTLRAMSLVYTTLLSLVPLLALTFSVLKGFGVQNQLEPALVNTLSALGDKGEEIARQIVGFVDNIKVGVLGSLGLGMLIYTVVSLLHKIEKSFNYIWHIDKARPLGQRFSEYLSVILVGPLLIFSALGMTASLMSSSVVGAISSVPLLGLVVASIGKLIPYALVIVAFTFVYIFMPNTKVKIGPALIGGAVAGIAWETAGWAFGTFVVNSGNYTAIYSGFAILIMFMIWLFVSWLILLLGTSIAFYCQNPGHIAVRRNQQGLSPLLTEKLSLLAMFHIGQHYYRHQTAWQIDELARKLGAPLNVTQDILDTLQARQLIIATSEGSPPYVPAQDMETLPVKHILDAVRSGNEESGLMPWRLAKEPVVDQMMQAADEAVDQAMQHQTLKDMVLAGLGKDAKQNGKEL
ncbi:MAG: ribonuclease BN [Zetaproteobacteria bacterium CG12_big_fil_rev_8_21_14_0_65_55_1124]|nr:MAG: ribonuclease BN [Zetaproteobacteria bacterium CG08_land_8_20_14_0_20_55_17]PIW43231.1 MAG: ribonuclease BN [Zetaproteobacteria bacterium CG12_big_fil_rev_8_21_14_0_65_55_1124]PIY51482.1 MAG: ribonuclease BN [Zetaproteobacteria bacterium CG_4_10_14_0_8_um_filter_55_43]PIZ39656.1 MAG: ribonuclease BN [Zetaproteobacteria bacterium CG_4_10_14_0_2_um_filter_55_20]PJB80357.1 MAG: ribonuclease BN [Zetaproteobacteria bacterium CG_4_9_14_0_8_um_filter_55_31]